MNKIVTVSGFCPTQNKEYCISITYLDVSNFQNPHRYIQGMADCKHGSFGNCPIMKDCPLRAKAPKELNGV